MWGLRAQLVATCKLEPDARVRVHGVRCLDARRTMSADTFTLMSGSSNLREAHSFALLIGKNKNAIARALHTIHE
jgi:putative heme degradation protein